MSDRLGVLLMTYGSPADDLHDLPEYLAAVRGGRAPSMTSWSPSSGADTSSSAGHRSSRSPVPRRRPSKTGCSPTASTHQPPSACGSPAPTIADGLRELRDLGCERVSAIVMSPQYSELLMSRLPARDRCRAGGARAGRPARWRLPRPGMPSRGSSRRSREVRDGPAELPSDTPVLLTAHSLPRRVADAEPGYLDQLRVTAEAVRRPPASPRTDGTSAGSRPATSQASG